MRKKEHRQRTPNGERLAAFRKAAGFSQADLAEALKIPQRTLAFYELDADHVPSNILEPFSRIFKISIEEILGIEASSSKRGPKSKMDHQLEQIAELPKSEQKKLLPVIEAFVAQYAKSS